MPAGVYIHIPFCRSRCSYCDFATDVYTNAAVVERYVAAVTAEISNFKFDAKPLPIDTIYFGGGTPSLLTANQVDTILNAVYKRFDVLQNVEATMEMNPATVTLETLREYSRLGINRASFGAQTFDDVELKRLGRKHTAADVCETIELLRRADFSNVSFDLIAGLPRQTLADWERNLRRALALRPEHLSLYLLEIHEGTPLAGQITTGRQPLPDAELAAEMYELLIEKTAAAGYEGYEISNFCRSGFESRHNSKYWTFDPVYGFGCSAHSFDGKNKRWANERDTRRYVDLIENGNSATVETFNLDDQTARGEYAFLRLRLSSGLNLDEYAHRFGVGLEEYDAELMPLEESGLIEFAGKTLRLTEKGKLFSNEVFRVFV